MYISNYIHVSLCVITIGMTCYCSIMCHTHVVAVETKYTALKSITVNLKICQRQFWWIYTVHFSRMYVDFKDLFKQNSCNFSCETQDDVDANSQICKCKFMSRCLSKLNRKHTFSQSAMPLMAVLPSGQIHFLPC